MSLATEESMAADPDQTQGILTFKITKHDKTVFEVKLPYEKALKLIRRWKNNGQFDKTTACFRGFEFVEKIEIPDSELADFIRWSRAEASPSTMT